MENEFIIDTFDKLKSISGEKVVISGFSGVFPKSDSVLELCEHLCNKNLENCKSELPRVVLASGRQESTVEKIFDWLKSKPVDEEEVALLHRIFEKDIPGHIGRGYIILDTNNEGKTVIVSESVNYYCGVRRPLWFVFSGMGSQWVGMGADLMRVPSFRKAIERCHKVLEPKGVDIIKIISGPDKTIFDNILNAFLGIGAVQIGLTDILKEMGVEPDYIIGLGLGEIACAYQDNTLSVEESILATYVHGKAVLETSVVQGSLASISLKDVIQSCPPEIDIACRNSIESSTLSGPVEITRQYLSDLRKQNVFVREMPSDNIACNSKYIPDAESALLRRFCEVIKDPKSRSKKWISTSVPNEHWDCRNVKYSSSEYHTNNLLSPVLFEEAAVIIPENAVVVEIAPHTLLQAILKEKYPKCTHISLTRQENQDGVRFLLESIGKLYEAGYNPKVDTLYPKLEFPVSTQMPLLSHLAEWEQNETWSYNKEMNTVKILKSSSRDLKISIHDSDYSYIADNVINGVTIIPEAALLVYVWETVASHKNVDFRNLSITFRDIEFHSDVIVQPQSNVKVSVIINKRNDKFEITQNDVLVVSGIASGTKSLELQQCEDFPSDDFDDIRLNSKDVYRILNMRGFSYREQLQSLYSVNINQNNAFVKWTKNWVLYLDSLIQLNIFLRNHNGISKPKFIRNFKIHVTEHAVPRYNSVCGVDCFNARVDKTFGNIRSSGVQIEGIIFEDQQIIDKEPSIIRDKKFYPYFATENINMQTALEVIMQIVAENANLNKITLLNYSSQDPEIFHKLQETFDNIPNFNMQIKTIDFEKYNAKNDFILDASTTNVLICDNIFYDSKILDISPCSNSNNIHFVLTLEHRVPKNLEQFKTKFSVLTCMSDNKHVFILMKKTEKHTNVCYVPVKGLEINFSWISKVNNELTSAEKLVLVSENQIYSGILGFAKKLQGDGHRNLSLLVILDRDRNFDSNNEFYKEQLDKNMAVNILKKGQWGGYYYTLCDKTRSLKNFALRNSIPGNIEALTWVENSQCFDKTNLVQVSFSGLSLQDCQRAVDGSSNSNITYFGMDFSGIDKDCDRIMGLISEGAMTSSIEADPDLIWPVPDHWTLEDAATVPLPYVLAYYCLAVRYKLKREQNVLVTSAIEAFGQAVISLCLALDCTVFTTVTTVQQKMFLLRIYPKLKENNICFANEDNICSVVMDSTKNIGCHLVINNLTRTFYKALMKCVGSLGTFLDLTKREMCGNENVSMSFMAADISYKVIELSNIFKPECSKDKKLLQYYVCEGIARGIIIPLTRVVYSPVRVSEAFRLVSKENHIGRVLLKLRDPVIMNYGMKVTPRLIFNPPDVVIVVCDEKDLGVALTDKLIECGAFKVMLHMKPGDISGYAQYMFISWSKRKVSVELSSENLRTSRGCESIMKNAMKFGKVKAVFIVLDGKGDDNGVRDNFMNAYNKSCSVVLNLDLASRNCPSLSYFTIVTRVPETTSDEYALAVLERVSELRHEMGLPALVIRYDSLVEFNDFPSASNKLEMQTLSTFFSSIEISLTMKYKNVLTYNTRENEDVDFCKKISKILGVRNIEDLRNETTLQDLNLNEIPLKELRVAIKSTYKIDYPLQQINRMTIQSLKELKKKNIEQKVNFDCGMAALKKHIK